MRVPNEKFIVCSMRKTSTTHCVKNISSDEPTERKNVFCDRIYQAVHILRPIFDRRLLNTKLCKSNAKYERCCRFLLTFDFMIIPKENNKNLKW